MTDVRPTQTESPATDGPDLDGDVDPDCFDIYETHDGLRPIGSTVRRGILSKMRGRELTVPEMIDVTGLTKSTISTHLALLYKENLVGYREDPEDRRRKRYFLTARYVGMSCSGDPRAGRAVGPMTEECLGQPGGMSKALLRSVVAELRASGLDLRPLLRDTGRRVGETIGRQQDARGLEAWFAAASGFWADNDLGRLELLEEDGPVVAVRDCTLCCSGPDAPRMCGMTAGILEGMASEAMRTSIQVERARAPDSVGADGGCGCAFRLRLPIAETLEREA